MTNVVNVTNRGFEYIASMVAGSISTFPIPSNIGWGTANGSNATSTVLPAAGPGGVQGAGQWYDVGPYSESTESRVAANTPVIVSNNVATSGTITTSFVGTITAAQNEAIGESFLCPSTTKPFQTTVFAALTSGNSLTVSTTGAPSAPFYMQNNNEVILVGTVTSNTIYTLTRAVNGSTQNNAAASNGLSVGNIPGAGPSNPNHGDIFAHAGFIALSLNTGDSIQFTWQINVTS